MGYLFFQILTWLLLAFGLGGIVGWLLRGFTHALQGNVQITSDTTASKDDHIMVTLLKKELHGYKTKYAELEAKTATDRTTKPGSPPKAKIKQINPDWKPAALEPPVQNPDDLKIIRGIGPKIEKTLNDLGIYSLQQIADLSPENTLWINHHLRFPGRIGREKWVHQAKALIKNNHAI